MLLMSVFLLEDMSETMRNHEAEKATGMIPAVVFGRGQRQGFALQNGYLACVGVISGTLEMTSHAKLSSAMSEDRRE